MRRLAVFVDAGYFWVQAGHVLSGAKVPRSHIAVAYAVLRQELLAAAAAQFPGVDLLRVYWYDGPGADGKTKDHSAIENLDDFKLRLGTRNGAGDQKAVDGLIIADMIGLAQSRAISDALLVSGDADLTPGVIAAQGLGIRVHLLSMGPTNATSPYLRAEVDVKSHWDDETVRKFLAGRAAAAVLVAPAATFGGVTSVVAAVVQPGQILFDSALKLFETLDASSCLALRQQQTLPRPVDGALLDLARRTLNRSLDDDERKQLRKCFRDLLADNQRLVGKQAGASSGS